MSDSFTILKNPDESDSNFYYTFVYVVKKDSEYKLYFKKTYFSFDLPDGYRHVKSAERNAPFSESVSSFYTQNSILIFFYINKGTHLRIRAYSSEFTNLCEKNIDDHYSYGSANFFKTIHLFKR